MKKEKSPITEEKSATSSASGAALADPAARNARGAVASSALRDLEIWHTKPGTTDDVAQMLRCTLAELLDAGHLTAEVPPNN